LRIFSANLLFSSGPGLPDGSFSDQKIPIWVNFGGSCNGRYWYIFGHAVYFTAIRHFLWSFCICYVHMVSFRRFGILCQEKSGNPAQVTFFLKYPLLCFFTIPRYVLTDGRRVLFDSFCPNCERLIKFFYILIV
jgi:hypothetical protein